MVIQSEDGEKYACDACVRGHRVSSCTHKDRHLNHINKKGRPPTQCSHCRSQRKSRGAHVKCICAQLAVSGNKDNLTCPCQTDSRCTCTHKKDLVEPDPSRMTTLNTAVHRRSQSKPTIVNRRSDGNVPKAGHHPPLHRHNTAAHDYAPYPSRSQSNMGIHNAGHRSADSLPLSTPSSNASPSSFGPVSSSVPHAGYMGNAGPSYPTSGSLSAGPSTTNFAGLQLAAQSYAASQPPAASQSFAAGQSFAASQLFAADAPFASDLPFPGEPSLGAGQAFPTDQSFPGDQAFSTEMQRSLSTDMQRSSSHDFSGQDWAGFARNPFDASAPGSAAAPGSVGAGQPHFNWNEWDLENAANNQAYTHASSVVSADRPGLSSSSSGTASDNGSSMQDPFAPGDQTWPYDGGDASAGLNVETAVQDKTPMGMPPGHSTDPQFQDYFGDLMSAVSSSGLESSMVLGQGSQNLTMGDGNMWTGESNAAPGGEETSFYDTPSWP